ncbi:MAG TPA: hypothetical protein PKC73_02900 [Dermatophilaceae bacterium]|jgi:hypothetical protein|nr:hypothetical protein [Dermatophilaceae bacterium]HMT88563.1 hypothetical protein [Dermatophilaceae bacterium]
MTAASSMPDPASGARATATGFGPPPGAPAVERARPASYLPPSVRAGAVTAYGRRYALTAAAKPGIIPLAPLTLSEVIDGAINHLRRNAGAILTASAVVNASTLLPMAALLALLSRGSWLSSSGVSGLIGSPVVVLLLGLLGSVLATFLLSAVLGYAVSRATLGQRVSAGTIWRELRPRVGRTLVSQTAAAAALAGPWLALVIVVAALSTGSVPLTVAVALLGGLVCVVASAVLLPRLAVIGPALAVEQGGIAASWRRAFRLSRKRWGRVLGSLLVTAAASTLVALFLDVVQTVLYDLIIGMLELDRATDAVLSAVGGTLAALVTSTLVTPVLAGAAVLLYLDLRMRGEGLDLTLRRAVVTEVQP